ncbi:diguanylate cyclase [Hyphococcus luteus]|nr:diguanylate cyclase [Marinicaulis flavus]
MPFPGMSQDDMRKALSELDQALFNHQQWSEELNRTLICALPPDERDVADESYRHCRFGQWLYGAGAALISKHPSFKEIVDAHERMHQLTTDMLAAMATHGKVPLDLYERFMNSLNQMRLEILTAKRELEDSVYNIDPLSGAANRAGMLTRLREQQALVKRGIHSCALAMMDFDNFKRVNDVYGHASGDEVIAKVAKLVMSGMRPYDLFFRYGGEEFLICEPGANLEEAHALLERLRADIEALQFTASDGQSYQITASFGLALLDPDISVEQAIERADKAMYAAKKAGRNRVEVWEPSMSAAA